LERKLESWPGRKEGILESCNGILREAGCEGALLSFCRFGMSVDCGDCSKHECGSEALYLLL